MKLLPYLDNVISNNLLQKQKNSQRHRDLLAKSRGTFAEVDTEGQAVIGYRSAKGHIDGLVDMKEWDEPLLGIIPHEVKSITNANYKWISRRMEANWHHKLQAGMYALALGCEQYIIHYVAADDYRILSMLFDTEDIAADIENVITEVEEQLTKGFVPAFVAREAWQTNPDYQNYPEWSGLNPDNATEKLAREYPEAYKKLLSLKKGGE